jgi:hypothetical protein
VAKNSRQINIPERLPAPQVAAISTVGVVSIRPIGRANVYNMEIDDFHNFAVNGGLIVHNCIDAVRYAMEDDMRNVRVV